MQSKEAEYMETKSWECKRCRVVIDVAHPMNRFGKFALYAHTKNHSVYRDLLRENFVHPLYFTLKRKVVKPKPQKRLFEEPRCVQVRFNIPPHK